MIFVHSKNSPFEAVEKLCSATVDISSLLSMATSFRSTRLSPSRISPTWKDTTAKFVLGVFIEIGQSIRSLGPTIDLVARWHSSVLLWHGWRCLRVGSGHVEAFARSGVESMWIHGSWIECRREDGVRSGDRSEDQRDSRCPSKSRLVLDDDDDDPRDFSSKSFAKFQSRPMMSNQHLLHWVIRVNRSSWAHPKEQWDRTNFPWRSPMNTRNTSDTWAWSIEWVQSLLFSVRGSSFARMFSYVWPFKMNTLSRSVTMD